MNREDPGGTPRQPSRWKALASIPESSSWVVRDEKLVDHLNSLLERAERDHTLSSSTVARVVTLVVQNRPFVEGNDRVAHALLLALLGRLGKRPSVPDEQIAAFLRRVDTRLSLQEAEWWISINLTG